MKIVTWNVLAEAYFLSERYLHLERFPSVEGRYKKIISILKHIDADVICLQEVDVLFELMFKEANANFFVVFDKKLGSRPDGLLTAAKKDTFRFVSCLAAYSGFDPSPVQLVSLSTSGKSFSVCNNHIRWSDSVEGHVGVRMADFALSLLPSGPLVFVGDSNDLPGGPVRSVLSQSLSDYSPGSFTANVQGQPVNLDVVFGRDLISGASEVVFSADHPLPNVCPSDHLPVITEITF